MKIGYMRVSSSSQKLDRQEAIMEKLLLIESMMFKAEKHFPSESSEDAFRNPEWRYLNCRKY